MAKDDQDHLEPAALLERIVRLEGENQRLQKTLKTLAAQVELDDLGRAFKTHVRHMHTDLEEIYDYLYPVVYKLFPEMAADHSRLSQILKGKRPPTERKKPD